MRTDYEHLLVQQDGGVLTITMNRPEVLNAVSEQMLNGLGEILEEAARDESVRCVVLTGAGRAFGSGADLRGFASAHAQAASGEKKTNLQAISTSQLVFPSDADYAKLHYYRSFRTSNERNDYESIFNPIITS